jgi:hypothetical protein
MKLNGTEYFEIPASRLLILVQSESFLSEDPAGKSDVPLLKLEK